MSSNAATGLLARMLFGITSTGASVDPDAPDLAGDITAVGEHSVAATLTIPSGDTYRVTVEWLAEESP